MSASQLMFQNAIMMTSFVSEYGLPQWYEHHPCHKIHSSEVGASNKYDGDRSEDLKAMGKRLASVGEEDRYGTQGQLRHINPSPDKQVVRVTLSLPIGLRTN